LLVELDSLKMIHIDIHHELKKYIENNVGDKPNHMSYSYRAYGAEKIAKHKFFVDEFLK